MLGDVLESIDKPFKIPQLPSTEILLVWRFMTGIYFPFHNSRKKIVFVADRAALAYFFGWQLQAGTYSSGVTVERRHSWRDGLYVSESSKRYWDVGTNYERWKKIQKILKNPSKESQKSRKARAEKEFGRMNGPPIVCRYMKRYPQVLKIHATIPTMHTKIHFCAYVMSPTLHHVKMTKTSGFKTLVRRFDEQRDSLEHGKLCTNARGLFTLSER